MIMKTNINLDTISSFTYDPSIDYTKRKFSHYYHRGAIHFTNGEDYCVIDDKLYFVNGKFYDTEQEYNEAVFWYRASKSS